jgi:dihydropteroate synthase
MHWRGHSADMQARADYGDVVRDVTAELTARREAARAAGWPPTGSSSTPGLASPSTRSTAGRWYGLCPSSPGSGRCSSAPPARASSGRCSLAADGTPRPADDRDDATAAVTVLAARAGAWAVRVHAVRASADAVRVVAAAAPGAGA